MDRLRTTQLVIFDCDGVLVDSEVLASGVQSEVLRSYGLDLGSEEITARFVGVSAADMRVQLETLLGRPLPADHEAHCAAMLSRRFRERLRPIAGIERVIDAVVADGYVPCVASGSSPERIALALRVTGLDVRFGTSIFSATMVAHGKPAPDLFLYAATEMGFAPGDCIVIEDSVHGVRAARAAGMRVIGFSAGSHCGPDYEERLRAAGAPIVARDAVQLMDRLRRETEARR